MVELHLVHMVISGAKQGGVIKFRGGGTDPGVMARIWSIQSRD